MMPEQNGKPKTKRPLGLTIKMALYIAKNLLRGRRRFPLVTMLEPLELCNLECIGCGRIREYKPVIEKMLPLEEALAACEASGAPLVSIAGGEPTIYPKLPELVRELISRKHYIYCCTNGLLMEKAMEHIPPSSHFCWVVHLDGMEEAHDYSVARKGVFKKAVAGIELALRRGYRVCTNTTVFQGSDVGDLTAMFQMLTRMGVEGCIVSPGYDFEDAPDQDFFLTRQKAKAFFASVFDQIESQGIRFYNNPLYLNFLRGKIDYQCAAWSNPTYTIQGWRKPCYALSAEGHTENVGELFEESLWEKYGVGKDERCANCMMHCGFESATIFSALKKPKELLTMMKSGVPQASLP